MRQVIFCSCPSFIYFCFDKQSSCHFHGSQKEVYPDKQPRQLEKLSDTRWTCRYSSINAICYTFESLLMTLDVISNGSHHSKVIEARGLLHQVKQFKFLMNLIMFDRLLSCTNFLSQQLQNKRINLSKAADLVLATLETLEEFREERSWNHFYDYSKNVAHNTGIEIAFHNRRDKRVPIRLENMLDFQSIGSRKKITYIEQCKVNVYYQVIDSFISEINRRFTTRNLEIMKAIHACSPDSNMFLDPDCLLPMVDAYSLDRYSIRLEATLAKRSLKGKEMGDLSDVIRELYPLKDAFPTLFKPLQISITIAVSTAECERSFSAMKRIKRYLRTNMLTSD